MLTHRNRLALVLAAAIGLLPGCAEDAGGSAETALDASDEDADTSTSVDFGDGDPGDVAGDGSEAATDATTATADLTDTANTTDTTTGADGTGDDLADAADTALDVATDTGDATQPNAPEVSLEGGRLALRGAGPALTTGCTSECDDLDQDGLVDAWETVVLEAYRPQLVLDEAERLVDDPNFVVAFVGRVTPVSTDPLEVRVYIMLGYSEDYGSCGLTDHHGDSERVALSLAAWPEGGAGAVVVEAAYTAAHEGTVSDHSMVFRDGALDGLEFATDPVSGAPRWVVYASANKHATYATAEICEHIAPLVPCVDEDCAPDGVADPVPYILFPPVVNAGEPSAPLVTDLAAIGFPGDDAWADQDFCGGLGGNGCSSSVREKLTNDPF